MWVGVSRGHTTTKSRKPPRGGEIEGAACHVATPRRRRISAALSRAGLRRAGCLLVRPMVRPGLCLVLSIGRKTFKKKRRRRPKVGGGGAARITPRKRLRAFLASLCKRSDQNGDTPGRGLFFLEWLYSRKVPLTKSWNSHQPRLGIRPPPCARWPGGALGSWLAGYCPWVLVFTGACYWHGVGGFVFNSSSSSPAWA